MKIGVIVLNFGEPVESTLEAVVPFLERIFLTNARLEGDTDPEAQRRRSRELAERRAPGLVEEYERIDGSPMNAQAFAQSRELDSELRRRGHELKVYSAFQFTDPLVHDVVKEAKADGVTRLIGVPIYPLCGPSTTVAALNDVQRGIDAIGGEIELLGFAGWHRHPRYMELRADAIRRTAEENALDLRDPETRLVFSAHGTPMKYLTEGSRYVEYVETFCRGIAGMVEVEEYGLGYQNHANRGIEWTQPDVEEVIRSVRAKRVLVDPVSFMHEQSETLAELDLELKEEAEELGLEFHRVPVPHDDPRFASILADLVEAVVAEGREGEVAGVSMGPCRCRPVPGTVCMNTTAG